MYYPYLRARQYELIALRDLVLEGVLKGKIMPLLEPVKESFTNLYLAHDIFTEKDFKTYLIVNPRNGDLKGDGDTVLSQLTFLNTSTFLPAFHYHDNPEFISSKIQEYQLNDCMLVCSETFSDEQAFRKMCENPKISRIMLLEPNKYRGLDRFIKSLGKNYIRLDDVFERQQKNADYLGIPEHKLTEEHMYFGEDGYQGFADYTVLPSEFIDGGSTPRAVVVHFSYLKSDSENEIWIRHFTSSSNDSIANVQGKFAEAANKAIQFCNALPLINSATEELRMYVLESRYPGLGTLKKISLKNHLLVVNEFLG